LPKRHDKPYVKAYAACLRVLESFESETGLKED